MGAEESKATAKVEQTNDAILLKVGGTWRLTETLPELEQVMPGDTGGLALRVVPEKLVEWDSSLPLFLLRVRSWCRAQAAELNLDALPEALKRLFRLISESEEREPPLKERPPEPNPVLRATRRAITRWRDSIRFVGECAIGAGEVPLDTRHFSWKDFFQEMVEAGPKSLPIIGLLSFLIGITFAFEVAQQLRHFGAQIWVINGVGLAVLRQTGPLIAAVVLAGRTGAAFAAHIGNMKLGGEIDALEMLGVSPINFLVLPRVAALVLMMPLITLYSDLWGILGALTITVPKLNIPVTEYWVQLQSAVSLTDVNVGIVKSLVFGLLIALAGTLRGLQSERSSVGVGHAVTSAVVLGITAIVMADALFAPILSSLHL
jgi:phospholipid/cholesterol/gamma-HCH transport system permease protein